MSARRRNGVQQRQRRFQRAHLLITVSRRLVVDTPFLVGALSRPSSSSLAARMAPRRGAAAAPSLLSVPDSWLDAAPLAELKRAALRAGLERGWQRVGWEHRRALATALAETRRDALAFVATVASLGRDRAVALGCREVASDHARAMAPGAAARRDKAATAALRERLGAAMQIAMRARCTSSRADPARRRAAAGTCSPRALRRTTTTRRRRRRTRGGGGGGGRVLRAPPTSSVVRLDDDDDPSPTTTTTTMSSTSRATATPTRGTRGRRPRPRAPKSPTKVEARAEDRRTASPPVGCSRTSSTSRGRRRPRSQRRDER